MAKLVCPSCQTTLTLKVASDGPATLKVKPQQNGQITPLTSGALRDVLEILRGFEVGQKVSIVTLYNAYLRLARERGYRHPLTKYAFSLGVRRYDLQRWRNASARGYIIPDDLPAEPLKITDAARERRDAEDYRQTVATPIADRQPAVVSVKPRFGPGFSAADLPFEMDLSGIDLPE